MFADDALAPTPGDRASIPEITPEEVAEVLHHHFRAQATSGLSGLPCFVLKYLHPACFPPLAAWLTHCLRTRLPKPWHTVALTPLFKGGGDPAEPRNYRPLAVISPLAKLLALVLLARLEALPQLLGAREP